MDEHDESIFIDEAEQVKKDIKTLTRIVGNLLIEQTNDEDLDYFCRKLKEIRKK